MYINMREFALQKTFMKRVSSSDKNILFIDPIMVFH